MGGMKIDIAAHRLAQLIEHLPTGVRVLSLDCFDTLIWRATHKPVDVFEALPGPATSRRRRAGERDARVRKAVTTRVSEVDLAEIYRCTLPGAAPEAIERAVAAELASEHDHCYAFPPAVALIRAAKARGLRVIIVSDTYLHEPELRDLIARAAGADVEQLLDHVFCSCELERGKSDGMFEPVLQALGLEPESLFHVGDNYVADAVAPDKLGIHCAHMVQFDDATLQQLRLESTVGQFVDPAAARGGSAAMPHRPWLSLGAHGLTGAERLGYAVMGPIMQAFVGWVRDDALRLAADGRPSKLVFLMRDGHLPLQSLRALDPTMEAHAAEISRFAALAASFRSERDIVDCLSRFANLANLQATGEQLLLTADEIALLERVTQEARGSIHGLLHAIRKLGLVRKVCERSKRYATRLFAHLRQQAGVRAGDRVVLVDLGYSGTVQTKIQRLLETGMDVQVQGRYLLLRDVPEADAHKRGLIEPSNTDARAIDAICQHIAIVEQICTVEQASVIDYRDDGSAVRRSSDIKGRQVAIRHQVQAACLRYLGDVRSHPVALPAAVDRAAWARAAVAMLTRFIYLASPDELSAVTAFEHDINLGSKKALRLFDTDYAHARAQARGMCYLNGTSRLYLPAEVRSLGMASSVMLLAQRRFGMEMRREDFGHQERTLPVMVVSAHESIVTDIKIEPTHDGWWLAILPVTERPSSFGLMFGSRYRWVQLERVERVPVQRLFVDGGEKHAVDLREELTHEGMVVHEGGLLECSSEQAFTFIAPQSGSLGKTIAVVFRPVVERPAAQAEPAPSSAEAQALGA
jgi:FMN phosphatase YigB (HAD superfamily)